MKQKMDPSDLYSQLQERIKDCPGEKIDRDLLRKIIADNPEVHERIYALIIEHYCINQGRKSRDPKKIPYPYQASTTQGRKKKVQPVNLLLRMENLPDDLGEMINLIVSDLCS